MIKIKTFFADEISSWEGREFNDRMEHWFEEHHNKIEVLEMIPQTVCNAGTHGTKTSYTLTIKYRILNFDYEFFNRGEKIK